MLDGIDAYALGDRLLDVDFQDAVSDSLAMMFYEADSDGHRWGPDRVA
jgi:hypothetical protein